ncbi:MAG: CopD family protein [Phototrophicaceae bacterium]
MKPYYRLALLLFCLVFINGIPVQAHGYIVRSIPEDRSTLERPPARIQYWFSEALEPDFSAINLRNDRGDILASGAVDDNDDSLLTLRVPQDLPDGAYIVELRPAFASDGHVVAESRVFFVGEEIGGVFGQAASDQAIFLEVVWKAILINSTYVLFGAAMLYAYILIPVWGNKRYPQGLLPPRVMQRLNWMMGIGITLAVLANVMGLLQQSMVFFGTSLDLVLSGNLWQVVRIGSRFGDVWNFRMLILLAIIIMHAAGLYYRAKFPKVVRSFWVANTYLLALLIGAQAVNSHAAGSLVMPWNAILVHWLHALSVAFWVGGIIALTFVLPVAMRPYEGDARWQALQPLMRRFSRYVVGAVVMVIASGIYSASNWFYTPNDFVTSYGAALGYKLLMVVLLLFVGGLHHVSLRPHLMQGLPFKRWFTWAKGFNQSLQIETLIGILTLILAALLSSTPIPDPDFLSESNEPSAKTQRVGDYDVQMSLAPAAIGINSVDFTIRRNILLIDDVSVDVQFVLPQADNRSDWLLTENVAQGFYAIVDDTIDRTGAWLALVDIRDADGQLTRFVFDWTIQADSGVATSRPASWIQIMAALIVLASVLYAIYPLSRKVASQMDWSTMNLVISVGIILMTAIALGASAVYLEDQARQIDNQQNPPPMIINTITPDMGSIAIGGTLLQIDCPTWSDEDALLVLSARLDRLRDEDLFAITQEGWRDLPACDALLSTTQRWHIVNYLRTLRR